MLIAALDYAARGWLVFPIREPGERYTDKNGIEVVASGKEPATAHGYLDATIAADQIRKWWAAKPDRNIGLVTSPASGIWVLDCDIDADTGEFGTEALDDLKKEHGALPPHPIALTPGGGQHHFFAWPDDGQDLPRRIRFLPGLDALAMRGTKGGYLVAPPSRRGDGGEYRWEISPAIIAAPQAPTWLLEQIRYNRRERPADMDRIRPVRSDATSAYGRAALMDLCAEIAGAPPGQQDVTLRDKAVRVGSLAYGGNIEINEAFSSVMAAAMQMSNQAGRSPWTEQELESKVRRHFAYAMNDPTPPPASRPDRPVYAPPPRDDDAPEQVAEIDQDETEKAVEKTEEKPKPRFREPFQYLGYTKDGYHYLPDGKGQIVTLKSGEHTALRLIELAPLDYWRGVLGVEEVDKESWTTIADGLMRQSEQAGVFDPANVRGRGAWIDGKRVVVHTGSEVIIDGEATALNAAKSRYVYERGASWEFGFGDPANTPEAHRLVEICDRLTWADKLSGALLAGFCIIAPVSGALNWRPHIWVTGGSGSGKSTVQNDIVGRIVGPAAERFDGKATEAGIRQIMGYDARPVLLDEAESEDAAGILRMQGVLDLARVASSGGRMVKGSQSHRAVTFVIRSCFCFSSINTSVRHKADESRISKLVLVPNRAPDADDHYLDLVRDINAWFTPEYASAMFARTVKYLPALLANIETFKAAASTELRNRRAADQLGPMLAGYYLCHSTGKITVDKAREFIARHNWADYVAIDSMSDELRLLEHLMSQKIRVNGSSGSFDVSVGVACMEANREDGRQEPYTAALGQVGIKVEGGMIAVSDSASVVRGLLRDAPQWQGDWKRPLRNLPGATAGKPMRFAPGILTRATWVPLGLLDGTYHEREPGED
jgi:putative DNA primase/helicase